ncbi:hypothetical protein ACF0H5_004361 [Mactra antiquata]
MRTLSTYEKVNKMETNGKCDVEISITLDGLETVETVPECLQEVFLCSSPTEEENKAQNHVTLPNRYAQWVNNWPHAQHQQNGDVKCEEKLGDREKDLGTALRWIKQEMVIMKEQDKALVRQFVTLRSKIMQLRCMFDLNDSYSDLSLEDSTYSVDDFTDGTQANDYLSNPDMDSTDFRERTASLLIPRNEKLGPITRIKWKSHEYL